MDLDFSPLTAWINEHGLSILLILLGATLVRRFGMVPLEGFIRQAVKTSRFQTEAQHRQREQTLLDISRSIFSIVVWIAAVVLIFVQLNIDVGPLLAAGGFLGIIIGFGTQDILKDIFAGIYVITEHQYQVGDVVDLDGDAGKVEDISLRMTTLRDLDGAVHHIPHGSVRRAKNLSKDYARVNLNIGVSYKTDLDKAITVINETGKNLAHDDNWKRRIITPPQFFRVDNLGDSSIELKIVGETKPLEHWDVTGELRKRLKVAFDMAGIEIPYPQQVVHQIEESRPVTTKDRV